MVVKNKATSSDCDMLEIYGKWILHACSLMWSYMVQGEYKMQLSIYVMYFIHTISGCNWLCKWKVKLMYVLIFKRFPVTEKLYIFLYSSFHFIQLGHLSFPLLGLFFLDVIRKRRFFSFFSPFTDTLSLKISQTLLLLHKKLVIDISLTSKKPVFAFIAGSLAGEMSH